MCLPCPRLLPTHQPFSKVYYEGWLVALFLIVVVSENVEEFKFPVWTDATPNRPQQGSKDQKPEIHRLLGRALHFIENSIRGLNQCRSEA